MEISIDITTSDLTLITSGTFMTIDEKPIQMEVLFDGERTVSVVILFHHELHPSGKSVVRNVSKDRTIDEWHIYDSVDGESERTVAPVPVVFYEDDLVTMAIYLQLHTQRLSDGSVKVDYAWWDGECVKPAGKYKV